MAVEKFIIWQKKLSTMENPILNKRQMELLLAEALAELEKDPANPELLTLIPMISALSDSYGQTLDLLEKTLITIRNEPKLYLLKAHCHLRLKEYDLMKQEYLRFTRVESKEAYWEDDITILKIKDDEELADLMQLIIAEFEIHLSPFLNTVNPPK
ncbi:MAG: hypothetical protein IT236_17435 [Bacteroidia bacterium]|nr:hypothetical protein [Bacteroidia bacterium]